MFPIMSHLGSPSPLICNISPSHSVYLLLMFDIISCLNELSTYVIRPPLVGLLLLLPWATQSYPGSCIQLYSDCSGNHHSCRHIILNLKSTFCRVSINTSSS